MKKEKLIRAIGEVDGRFIDEAAPPALKKRKAALFIPLVAATLILAILLSATLFILVPLLREDEPSKNHEVEDEPSKDHEGGEYSHLIEKLSYYIDNVYDPYSYGGNDYADNLVPEGGLPAPGEPSGGDKDDESSGSPDQSYENVADNQVEGIVEADAIKRSDKYAYYMDYGLISAYSITGESSVKLSTFNVGELVSDDHSTHRAIYDWEMQLSSDCKTLTVMAGHLNRESYRGFVDIIALDVSTPEIGIFVKNRISMYGEYLSSRMIGDSIFIMTGYSINVNNVDFKDPTTFVPSIEVDGVTECVPAESILFPDELTNKVYTLVTRVDANTLELEGSGAFLSYSQDVYVSQNSIYAIHNYTDVLTEGKIHTHTAMCSIAAMDYSGNELTPIGSVTLEGRLKDQYSLDEYKGILRAVTTTSVSKYEEFTSDDMTGITCGNTIGMSWLSTNTNASLYCVNLETMSVVSSVKNFAPNGETVQSVRFDEHMGYVCTAVKRTDPVYFFDLSDVSNITYKETDPITGFSSSLITLKNGYLLGIGEGEARDTLKIEIYAEAEDKIVSVGKYEIEAKYSTEYKSYYIDRENCLLGLGIYLSPYTENKAPGYYYLLLSFESNAPVELFQVRLSVPWGSWHSTERMRGFYADGYFYIFAGNDFRVVNIG